MNDIQKSFYEEVREKKRAANGVHSKTGKNGYVGKMKMPSDLLKGKEKRKYEGTSPVTTSNVYDHIIPHEAFKNLSRNERILHIYEYRKRFTAKQIADAWGVTDKTVYYYYRAYGTAAGANPHHTGETSANTESTKTLNPHGQADRETAAQLLETDCSFVMKGVHDGHAMGQKLQGLALMSLDGKRYQVDIRIRELV